jgi:hypothetical protein
LIEAIGQLVAERLAADDEVGQKPKGRLTANPLSLVPKPD